MKVWQIIVLIVILTALPVMSACASLGFKSEEQKQQEYYNEQLRAVQEQRDAYQKQMEEYYKARNEGLKLYEEAYGIWWKQQQEAKLGQYELTDNQTDNQTAQ